MSQLNLKQILSGDTLSTVVDKLNYNFNQLVLNGGGPQGLRGLIGAPGLPGAQGLQGLVGPKGETGTHIYADGASPGVYPFGTGGEILPRVGDVFIETDPTYLSIWELSPTGASSSYWNLVQTITSPGSGLSKLVYDQTYGTSSAWTAASNDPAIAAKFLIGSTSSLYGSFLIDPAYPIGSSNPKFRAEFSAPAPFSNSMVTLASTGNQLRFLDTSRDPSTILTNNGGVIHSLTDIAGESYYSIRHADSTGEKHFSVKLSEEATRPTLLYGDKSNRLAIGLSDNSLLISQLTVNSNFAVGNPATGFYLGASGATFAGNIGGIIEGNVAIGRNRNSFATLGVYNRPSQFGASLRIDTDITGATTSAVSDIFLGGNMYQKDLIPTTNSNFWRIRHDSSTASVDYRKLLFLSSQQGLTGGTATTSIPVLTMGAVAFAANPGVVYPQVKIGGEAFYAAQSTQLSDSFEVGVGPSTVALGLQTGGPSSAYMTSHISMGMSRNVSTQQWTRFGDNSNNAGRSFWSSAYTGLGLSIFGATGGTDVSGITDTQVYNNTRVYFGASGPGAYTGNLILSETRPAANYFGFPGLLVDSGATGTTGSGLEQNVYRRFIGFFGDGPVSVSTKLGTPMIATTNGITQSLSTGHGVPFVPHYTWAGNDQSGLYLAVGTTANSGSGNSVGLVVDGQAALSTTNSRVGIFQPNPLDILHIGNKLVYHNGGYKSINYNLYYNGAAGGDYRIEGSTASGQFQQGAFKIGFAERNRIDGVTGETAYRNFGASLNLQAYGMGGTQTSLSSPTVGRTFRGMKVCPPPVGPTTSGWNNLSSNIPQVMIGLTDEEAINSFVGGRRGTLSIASQFRVKPATSASPPTGPFGVTIEDQYNIGLYNYEGYPVSAIYSGGGNYGTSTVKTFGINFLGEGGNAIAGDVPFLYATTDATLSRAYQRTANFGINFRIGINAVPPPQPIAYTSASDPIFNFAGLIVGGYSEAIPSGYEQAIISKGTLTIDQSTYSGGGGANQGLIIKDNTITTTYGTTRFSTSEYYGDWGIQYTKANASEAGLNFWKPSGGIGSAANGILYLSDNGNISIGFDPYSATGIWTTEGTYSAGTKFAVNGGGKFTGDSYFSGRMIIDSTSNQTTSTVGPFTTENSSVQIKFGSTYRRLQRLSVSSGQITAVGELIQSDLRLKKNVSSIGEVSDLFNRINFVSYEWNDEHKNQFSERSSLVDPRSIEGSNEEDYQNYLKAKEEERLHLDGEYLGVIAQELETVFPDVVKEVNNSYLVDKEKLNIYAMKTIQELYRNVQEKDEKIKNLEDKLSKIEALLSKNGIK
jgi:hypothetical protein